MSDSPWQRIEEVFHQALALEPEARTAFLNQVCGADEALRREVESLLAHESESDSTFMGPARIGESQPLQDGTVVSHYRLLGKLGEGGMGIVYRAEDLKLRRQVAVKFLPPNEGEPPQSALRRFEQEARAASALNHPNICTVHGLEGFDGKPAIVMELVEGETLASRIARGRLTVAEALRLAIQIAGALSEAHRHGVVHRDLKPANVMITDSGLVKVLDFGLARLTRESRAADPHVALTRSMTQEGMLVGSVPYMSPEQAEGKKVDERSDIFSFGAVLYEMLSGKRAFNAETAAGALAAVLRQEPAPLPETVPGVPKELERIFARCLRKDITRRSQSMAEIKVVLEELKEETEAGASTGATAVKKSARRWPRVAYGGALLTLFAALFLALPYWRERPAAMKEVPLTTYPGYQGEPTLSPDGSQVAFVWDGGRQDTPPQLYVSPVRQGTPLRLTNTPGAAARHPSWSPDGQRIAFLREVPAGDRADLIVIPALAGPERKISEAALYSTSLPANRPAWSPDGKWLYFSAYVSPQTFALFVVPSVGGEKTRLLDPPDGVYGDESPSVSPDGRQLVFIRSFVDLYEDLFVASLRDGVAASTPKRLTNDHGTKSSPVWTAGGEDIVYIASEQDSLLGIYRIRASGGTPKRIEGMRGDHPVTLAIAPKGQKLAYGRSYRHSNIYRVQLPTADKPAGAPAKFLSSTRDETSPAYSPDGKRIAFESNRSGVDQIWLADADGSNPMALTNFTRGSNGSPNWSPDGQTIVFDARPEDLADIYSISAQGGTPRRLTDHRAENHLPIYSVDGRWIYFSSTRSGVRQIYRMPSNGGDAVQITRKGAFWKAPSPDGKWIYYTKQDGGVWKVPADGGEEAQVLDARTMPTSTRFAVTASGVYFAGPLDPASGTTPLNLYRFADGQTVERYRFDKPISWYLTVSPDERWLLYTQIDSSVDDLMLVENFR